MVQRRVLSHPFPSLSTRSVPEATAGDPHMLYAHTIPPNASARPLLRPPRAILTSLPSPNPSPLFCLCFTLASASPSSQTVLLKLKSERTWWVPSNSPLLSRFTPKPLQDLTSRPLASCQPSFPSLTPVSATQPILLFQSPASMCHLRAFTPASPFPLAPLFPQTSP